LRVHSFGSVEGDCSFLMHLEVYSFSGKKRYVEAMGNSSILATYFLENFGFLQKTLSGRTIRGHRG
jgi:hypothetical protein